MEGEFGTQREHLGTQVVFLVKVISYQKRLDGQLAHRGWACRALVSTLLGRVDTDTVCCSILG